MSFKSWLKIAVLVAPAFLTGCQALDSGLTSVSDGIHSLHWNGGAGSTPSAPPTAEPPQADVAAMKANCPAVFIDPASAKLHQFTVSEQPTDAQMISTAHMVGLNSTCRVNDKNAIVNIDIAMTGLLGPAARSWKTARPSFAYPYILKITGPDGHEVSSEVFAASMTYAPGIAATSQSEHIRQLIPLNAQHRLADYRISVGFQLTPAERAFNAAHPDLAAAATARP